MKDYLYDGSFEGALTGIYQMFNDRVKAGEARLVSAATYQRDCFTIVTEVETDPLKAEKVTKWLLEEFGEIGFRRAAYAYLSDDEQYGTYLFCFLKKMNRLGEKGLDFFADQDINKIYKIYNKVCRESHLLLGLIQVCGTAKRHFICDIRTYSQHFDSYDRTLQGAAFKPDLGHTRHQKKDGCFLRWKRSLYSSA